MKMRSTDPRATVVTYAFFHAFKFPDSMAVQIRCKVREHPENSVVLRVVISPTSSSSGGDLPLWLS